MTPAVEGSQVMYVGGTEALPKGLLGHLDTTSQVSLLRRSGVM